MTTKSVLALLGLLTLSTACGTSPTASASPPASVSSTPPSTLPQISPGPWPRQTSLAYDSTTKEIVLFGGFPYGGDPPYDTWTWSGHQWTLHPKADVSSPARTRYENPPGRAGAALADDPDHGVVVMFGGGDRSDTWLWDGTGWTQAQPVHSPWQRTGAAFVWDPVRHVDLLFGGQGGNDTWSWNGTDWTQLTPANSPPPRYYSRMAFDAARGKAVLFGDGGYAGRNDTWTWDGSTWTEQYPATIPPGLNEATPRPEQMAYDAVHHMVVMLDNEQTWVKDGTTWTQLSPSKSPPRREGSGIAFDAATGLTVWAGGFNSGGDMDSTWGWDGATWSVIR